MLKKLIQKYQAYKDKKFLARLNRVLKTNVICTSVIVDGNLVTTGSITCYLPKEEIYPKEKYPAISLTDTGNCSMPTSSPTFKLKVKPSKEL